MFHHKKIKKNRTKLDISVEEMSHRLHNLGESVTSVTIRNWEKGDTTPNAKSLEKIAKLFNKPVEYFFDK